ncbi:rCG50971 [Rattus norvegicus]|uniref:RCG50971 n=1 Tax=Rattus norvegicus TaxID=10116 RepID=A6KGJ4_RAT|nr:rCG50971 [Rattus norvegicus]
MHSIWSWYHDISLLCLLKEYWLMSSLLRMPSCRGEIVLFIYIF